MNDIRYSELVFLRELSKNSSPFDVFSCSRPEQYKTVGLDPNTYANMAATLLEDMYVEFDEQHLQLLVSHLRGELWQQKNPGQFLSHEWESPRITIRTKLTEPSPKCLRVTYRGLRRIEELRELLQRDRILEPFGVLLDLRYFRRDLEDALRRGSEVPVSVFFADLDDFKVVNTKFGHAAGDLVMKSYLEAVRDGLGVFGTAFRGRGDEVVGLVVGQSHERSVELAQDICKRVREMRCEHDGKTLPSVTATIGLASTPSEERTPEIETMANDRNRLAKKKGKNRVAST